MMKQKLTQKIFDGQPEEVNWVGVDYDGTLNFGVAVNPRYTWASEQWRGYNKVGNPIPNTEYEPLTSLYRGVN